MRDMTETGDYDTQGTGSTRTMTTRARMTAMIATTQHKRRHNDNEKHQHRLTVSSEY